MPKPIYTFTNRRFAAQRILHTAGYQFRRINRNRDYAGITQYTTFQWFNDRTIVTVSIPKRGMVGGDIRIEQKLTGEWQTIAYALAGAGQTFLDLLVAYRVLPHHLGQPFAAGYEAGRDRV